jgi:tetratricopeptide (TPR) repeat protein
MYFDANRKKNCLYFCPLFMTKASKKKNIKPTRTRNTRVQQTENFPILKKTKWVSLGILLFALLLYANTLSHDYTQDDAIVIYDNMYTTQGIAGIPGLLTKDTFFGFFKTEGKAKLVSGGRYRPLTPIMFALEWQLFGRSPWIGHLINVLLYGMLGIFVFLLLKELSLSFLGRMDPYLFALLGAILYLSHPVHTEVIANIKGRDEIVSMLGSVVSLFWVLKAHRTRQFKWAVFGGIVFFLALMSKENAIMFCLIAPLTLAFVRKAKWPRIIRLLWPMAVATVLFLVIRTSILGFDMGDASKELMNNPFLKAVNQQYVPFDADEKCATILYTLGNYVRLLVFPHPLTHDYYPRHIDIMNFGDWQVWIALIVYLGLFCVSFIYRKTHPLISYGIWFYLITLFIFSNILFPIGTNMSERFLFMPSLGYAIILAYLLHQGYKRWSKNKALIGFGLLLVILFSAKTIVRNPVWKNDYTLFTTDIKTSYKSAKLLNAVGGALSNEAHKPGFEEQKEKMLSDAINYLKKALEIHPTYKNAYLILGNCYHYLKQYEQAVPYYETAIRFDPGFTDAIQNIGINYRELGRYYGQKLNDLDKATEALKKAYKYRSNEYETVRLLGISLGRNGKHQEAVLYFEEALKLKPNLAGAYVNLGNAYMHIGNDTKAKELFTKAVELDPKALNRN